MLATVYLDGKKLKRIRTLKGKTQRALSSESGVRRMRTSTRPRLPNSLELSEWNPPTS
jgi:transcriptional regulator with XRE-family HTH domain